MNKMENEPLTSDNPKIAALQTQDLEGHTKKSGRVIKKGKKK